MNKERLKTNFNVDANKIKWQQCENGGCKWETSRSEKGYYINKEGNNYTVVEEKSNIAINFTRDLSGLEEL